MIPAAARFAPAAAAAVLALAGCGSSGPAAPGMGMHAPPGMHAAPSAAPSAASLVTRLGCTHYQPTVPPGLFTREEGDCTLPDKMHVVLATFNTTDGERAWVQAEATIGGILVQGTGWAANAPTTADAATVTAKLGGRVLG